MYNELIRFLLTLILCSVSILLDGKEININKVLYSNFRTGVRC